MSSSTEHPRKLCIAVGPSPEAREAFQWAATKLVHPSDEVYLLNVVASTTKSEAPAGSGLEAGLVRNDMVQCEADPRDIQAAKQMLEQCKEQLKNATHIDDSKVHTEPRVACLGGSTDVGRTLIQVADNCGCDTMVIGSRGLGITRRAVLNLFGLGSVSSYVVSHAPLNVIVHKQTMTASAASPKE